MTCREFVDFLMDYLGGELPTEQRTCFEQHLSECPDCATYLQSYEATIRIGKFMRAEPSEPLPGDVPEDLVRAILAARRCGAKA